MQQLLHLSSMYDVPINEEITRGYQVTESTEPVTRQHIKNCRLKIKENLRNQYSQLAGD